MIALARVKHSLVFSFFVQFLICVLLYVRLSNISISILDKSDLAIFCFCFSVSVLFMTLSIGGSLVDRTN